jgi:hypothetical protein
MNLIFEKRKFQISDKIYKMQNIELQLRKKLHEFELKSLKCKEKTLKFKIEVLQPAVKEIDSYENQIKGFNMEMFFIGIALFHSIQIFRSKILLNEMGRKSLIHMFNSFLTGATLGYITGYSYSSSYVLLKTYRRVQKNIHKIDTGYDFYYVSRHEEIFDD